MEGTLEFGRILGFLAFVKFGLGTLTATYLRTL
jgi:hypothetical protein